MTGVRILEKAFMAGSSGMNWAKAGIHAKHPTIFIQQKTFLNRSRPEWNQKARFCHFFLWASRRMALSCKMPQPRFEHLQHQSEWFTSNRACIEKVSSRKSLSPHNTALISVCPMPNNANHRKATMVLAGQTVFFTTLPDSRLLK
jgi:hypothetical protein